MAQLGLPLEAVKDFKHRYIPLRRHATYSTVPAFVGWGYVERSQIYIVGLQYRTDLPMSQHPYGVIAVDRELTPSECEEFALKPVDAE